MPESRRPRFRRLGGVTNRAIAHARLRNSRLVGPPLATPEDVVRWFGAVQSQDVLGALWALAQRLPGDGGATFETVAAALDAGRFIRTHGPRPTWHFLHPAELRWILSLVGPRVEQTMAGMVRRLGISPEEMTRGQAAMETAMARRRRPDAVASCARWSRRSGSMPRSLS